MEDDVKKLISILKKQVELFLLEAKEFYPFGTYINKNNEIIPLGTYFENDRTPSLEVIDLLEKTFKEHIQKGDCKVAGMAIDVAMNYDNKVYDAIELRIFEVNKDVYKKYFKYEIKEHSVEFFDPSR